MAGVYEGYLFFGGSKRPFRFYADSPSLAFDHARHHMYCENAMQVQYKKIGNIKTITIKNKHHGS